MTEEKIYCKKCGTRIVPVNGECPRCGYVIEQKSKKIVLAAIVILLILALLKLLL